MRKFISFLLLTIFILTSMLAGPSLSVKGNKTAQKKVKITAKKTGGKAAKKKTKKKKSVKKKGRKQLTTKGKKRKVPQPTFPVYKKTTPPSAPTEETEEDEVEGYKYQLFPQAAVAGGALSIGLNLETSLWEEIKSSASIGYGLGKNYSVFTLKEEALFPLKDPYFVGLGIEIANYSDNVLNVPGIYGNIEKGVKLGISVSAIMYLEKYKIQAAYSSALGLCASAGYRIKF